MTPPLQCSILLDKYQAKISLRHAGNLVRFDLIIANYHVLCSVFLFEMFLNYLVVEKQ